MTESELKALINDAAKTQLKSLIEEREKLAAPSKPTAPEAPPIPVKGGDAPLLPENNAIGAVCRALCACKGDVVRAAKYAEKVYGHDIAAKALVAGAGEDGGFLVPPTWIPSLIELLVARTVVRRSAPTLLPMANGAASIPKMTGGATSAYLGEGDNIEPSQQTFGMVLFKARKLATLVPISNDLLRINAANADTIVQDDMASSMARREDLAFLRGDGGEHEPRGMFNHVPTANKFNANATVNLANVTTDLGKALLLLMEGHSRMLRPTWFMAPRTLHYLSTVRDGNGNFAFRDEVLSGRLWNYPLFWTTQIPVNLGGGTDESWILLADMADAVLADEMDMEFAFSSTATYYDGAQLRSGFSRDESVIRVISKHDFNIRHEESFALIEQVKWGA